MDVQTQLRNLKDFLMLYNRITENCFTRCVDEVNSRNLNREEEDCVYSCSSKFVKANQRMLNIYVDVQTTLINKRNKELEATTAVHENLTSAPQS